MARRDAAESRRPWRSAGSSSRTASAIALDAGGFDRHTFLCGQSGSGKTYSLGLVLERLLLETDLRVVILDPNSDFVRLADVRDGADAELASRYEAGRERCGGEVGGVRATGSA